MSRLADGGRIGMSAETTTTGTSDLEAQLDTKHPLTPVETTQAVTGSSHLITSGAVRQSVAAVIDSAPAALDTLNELAAALNNDANFAAGVTTSLASKENVLTFTTGAATGHGTLTRAGDTITFAPPVLPSGTPASAWSDYGQSSYDASNRLDAAFVGDGTVSDAEYAHLNGVTSSIQTQLDGKEDALNGAAPSSWQSIVTHSESSDLTIPATANQTNKYLQTTATGQLAWSAVSGGSSALPYVRLGLTGHKAQQNLAAASLHKVLFNTVTDEHDSTVTYDPNGLFDSSNNELLIPTGQAGIYSIRVSVNLLMPITLGEAYIAVGELKMTRSGVTSRIGFETFSHHTSHDDIKQYVVKVEVIKKLNVGDRVHCEILFGDPSFVDTFHILGNQNEPGTYLTAMKIA